MQQNIVDEYLERGTWKTNENANIGFSLQGLNIHIINEKMRKYWQYEVYDRWIREAHNKGQMHVHDLGSLCVYCVGWDLYDLLMTGFKGVRGKIESDPAKHFSTALMQIVNFIFSLQNESAGAQALSNFDTLLAPLIRYDNLTYKQVEQELQEFLYHMNVGTRMGAQSPFSNITMDLTCPEHFKNMSVIRGSEMQDEVYGDFQHEMNIINKIFAKLMIAGDSKGRPFTFPIPTYNLTNDFNWDSTIYDPIWEMTAKRGTGYFANFMNSDMNPEDARSMCCRLRLNLKDLDRRGGGLFGSNPLTGSIGVVTINMNQIAYLSKNESDFFARLDRIMNTAKRSLILKREKLEELTSLGLYPYSKFYLRNIENRFGKYWKNHFSTIGIIAMNDAIYSMFGCTIGDEKGIEFTKKVMEHMRGKLVEYQKETGDVWNLEATPAEGTSYRLAKIDRKLYPDIKIYSSEIVQGNEEYYTNSTQLPVGYTDNIQEAFDKQDDIQCLYTGGTVQHIYMGEAFPNPTGVKKLIMRIAENYRMPYFTFSPNQSICPNHGLIGGTYVKCPICNEECEVFNRVVGFFRPLSQYNKGKLQEAKDRKMFRR